MTTSDTLIPFVAGRFYPSDPDELKREVTGFLEQAKVPPADQPVLAILTPHAGYVFSGAVAAHSFKHVSNQRPDTVLFIAIAHQGVEGASVFDGRSFQTPLGEVEVDRELTEALIEEGDPIQADPNPYWGEHSIEVNLPFVQTVFPTAKIATLLITHTDEAFCKTIGSKIATVIRRYPDKKVLMVVSSDMSHYPRYDIAKKRDLEMLETLTTLDPDKIVSEFQRVIHEPEKNLHCVMCGSAAMLTAIEACNQLGASRAKILYYQNSGDIAAGSRDRVVGYGSLAIYGVPESPSDRTSVAEESIPTFSDEDKKELLAIARESIHASLTGRSYYPRSENPRLKIHAGVFVTLKHRNQLRGCLGRFDPGELTLDELVAVMAVQSARHDIRFQPVTLDELAEIDIQISVLTPRVPVNDPSEIEIGRHGLQIQTKNSLETHRSGTLLPQVAVEQGWDVRRFLESTCVKAGLDPQAWKRNDVEILKYEAIVFGDRDFSTPHGASEIV